MVMVVELNVLNVNFWRVEFIEFRLKYFKYDCILGFVWLIMLCLFLCLVCDCLIEVCDMIVILNVLVIVV